MKMKTVYGVYCDKTSDVEVVKDDFNNLEEAEKYIIDNNLPKDDYFACEMEVAE